MIAILEPELRAISDFTAYGKVHPSSKPTLRAFYQKRGLKVASEKTCRSLSRLILQKRAKKR